MTSNVKEIVDYVRELGQVNGLINNSHLGDNTTVDFVQQGAVTVTEAAEALNLPVIATYIDRNVAVKIKNLTDIKGNPIKILDRYMTDTFW